MKPVQYQIGIDTFERAEENLSKEKTNRVIKLNKEQKLKKLVFSERAAFNRQLFDLSNFYQNKINYLKYKLKK